MQQTQSALRFRRLSQRGLPGGGRVSSRNAAKSSHQCVAEMSMRRGRHRGHSYWSGSMSLPDGVSYRRRRTGCLTHEMAGLCARET